MSSVLPKTVIELLTFCEAHDDVWAAAPTAIGLTAPQVEEMQGLTADCRAAYDAAQAARSASKAATTTLNGLAATLRTTTADLVRQIKSTAALSSSPSTIYAAAQIPEPAAPTPLPAPGKPTDFTVTLNPDGSVNLSWMASESAASTGAFFSVSRKLPGMSSFVSIGGAPGSTSEARRCTFTDATVPASAASTGAQYIVQGFRGTRTGIASDAVTVQFGIDGGGGTQFTSASLKMAA
jgi:hypothetical protein